MRIIITLIIFNTTSYIYNYMYVYLWSLLSIHYVVYIELILLCGFPSVVSCNCLSSYTICLVNVVISGS